MIVNVHLLAFADEDLIRPVTIPGEKVTDDKNHLLELVFHYGQNDFQPSDKYYSVSVGDVVELVIDDKPEYHIVAGLGFSKMSEEEFKEYKTMNTFNRCKFRMQKT